MRCTNPPVVRLTYRASAAASCRPRPCPTFLRSEASASWMRLLDRASAKQRVWQAVMEELPLICKPSLQHHPLRRMMGRESNRDDRGQAELDEADLHAGPSYLGCQT